MPTVPPSAPGAPASGTRRSAAATVIAALLPVLFACGSDRHRAEFPERRQQLLLRLDEFVAEEGFIENSPRFLRLPQDPDRNVEDDALRLRVAPTCKVATPELEIPAGARLELGVGMGWIDELVPDEGSSAPWPVAKVESYETAFRLAWREETSGEDRPLGERRLAFPVSESRVRESWTVPLDEIAGERGRLVLETERTRGPVDLRVFPSWWSPTIVSAPPKRDAERAPQRVERERLVTDLLAETPGARVLRAGTLLGRVAEDLPPVVLGWWAGDGGPIEVPPVSIESHFETPSTLDFERGGSRPALAVADSVVLRWPPVETPPGGPVALRFELGVEAGLAHFPAASIELVVRDGGEELARETAAIGGPAFAEGWSRTRRIPLGAGTKHELELEARIECGAEGVDSTWPTTGEDGRTRPLPARLERARFGISRPRLVQRREVDPQPFGDADRPSVLILCAETLRADELGPWGGSGTPELDRWAPRGLVFHRAHSAASWTLPSVVSLLTGLDPGVHGAASGGSDQVADWCETLAEGASWEGVRTGAFVTNGLIRRSAGFAEGFDTFLSANTANAGQIGRAFLDWLSERPDERFFAYVHFFDPHTPYNAPGGMREVAVPEELRGEPYARAVRAIRELKLGSERLTEDNETLRFLRGRYRGEIRYLDRQLGELLDALEEFGVLENTLVAFVADHGEEFGEHAWYGHGNNLYEESTRVPLVLWGAGVRPGTVEFPVEAVSLTVRAAETLGLDELAARLRRRRPALPLAPVRGSGSAVWIATDKGVDFGDANAVFAKEPERLNPRPVRALVMGARKAILRMKRMPAEATLEAVANVLEAFALYDLERDPGEHDPVSTDLDDLPEDMRRVVLDRLAEELRAPKYMADERMTGQMEGVLEDLGYIEVPQEDPK